MPIAGIGPLVNYNLPLLSSILKLYFTNLFLIRFLWYTQKKGRKKVYVFKYLNIHIYKAKKVWVKKKGQTFSTGTWCLLDIVNRLCFKYSQMLAAVSFGRYITKWLRAHHFSKGLARAPLNTQFSVNKVRIQFPGCLTLLFRWSWLACTDKESLFV